MCRSRTQTGIAYTRPEAGININSLAAKQTTVRYARNNSIVYQMHHARTTAVQVPLPVHNNIKLYVEWRGNEE